ncbi:unnamed protein product [Somion occarium]|uniref:LSM complex subunit LSM4 n=1 Tax=Somion occarium TaxID=3059160 RepID=A0ABP1DVJ7_9APHY
MLPLSLLNAAQNKPMLVELKNGETFNGHLVNCDNFMNITLREVYQTNPEGDRFWKLKECYIRGSTIKYLRVPDPLLDLVKDEQTRAREAGRSARGGPGGGRGTYTNHVVWANTLTRFCYLRQRGATKRARCGAWWANTWRERAWTWRLKTTLYTSCVVRISSSSCGSSFCL